jgi:O-antigen/teichoic acid export membrane protein
MSEPRNTTSSIAGLMLAKVVRVPLWLLISAILARVLEPSGLGTWSMILAAATVLNHLLLHWTQSITQRFGRGEWLASGQLPKTWSTRWPLLVIGMAIVLLLLALEPFAWPERFYGLSGSLHWFILPALLTLWLMAEAQSLQQVRERFAALAASPIIADLALLAMLGLLLLARRYGDGKPDIRVALACITAVGSITWALWLARELRSCGLDGRLPEAGQWRRATRFAAPLIPGFLVGYLAEWCDYFLIRHYYSAYEVGIFHPAYQYLLVMVGLPTALSTVLLPRIVATSGDDKGASVRRLVRHSASRLTVAWSVLVLPLVAFLPGLFAWLLGERYGSSVTVLQILLIAVPGAVVQHVYGIAHFVQGRLIVSTLVLFGLKCLVNIAVSITLLPALGVAGSAIGSAVSYLALQWLFVLDQHRHLELRHGAGAIVLLIAQASGIALSLVSGIFPRLLVAMLSCLLILAWARQAALFSREDVSAMLPRWLACIEGPSQWLLCRYK